MNYIVGFVVVIILVVILRVIYDRYINTEPLYLGCFNDRYNTRAFPTNTGSRTYDECLNNAKANGSKYFALQNRDASSGIADCWTGNDMTLSNKYGTIDDCRDYNGHNLGRYMTNAVYSFDRTIAPTPIIPEVPVVYMGCFEDNESRAFPTKTGFYTYDECLESAQKNGSKYFALQNRNDSGKAECWTGNDMTKSRSNGTVYSCANEDNGYGHVLGGSWSNAIYSFDLDDTYTPTDPSTYSKNLTAQTQAQVASADEALYQAQIASGMTEEQIQQNRAMEQQARDNMQTYNFNAPMPDFDLDKLASINLSNISFNGINFGS